MIRTTERNYRETLDAAALAYLERRHPQYLGDLESLFRMGVTHLVASCGAEQALAENTVARAMAQQQAAGERRYLDVSASTCNTAVIVDPVSGISHSVPLYLICQLLDTPGRLRPLT